MQIGKLKPENYSILNECSKLGFSSKTKLIDAALDAFRETKRKEQRSKLREEMLSAHADGYKGQEVNLFASIDGDDFE